MSEIGRDYFLVATYEHVFKRDPYQICSQSPPESPREASCRMYVYLRNLRRNIPQPRPLQHACPHRSSTTNNQP